MTFKINRLKDHPLEPLSLLLWGPAKSGKSYLLGTLGPRTLIIDTGRGLSTFTNPEYIKAFPHILDIIVEHVYEDLGGGYVPVKAKAFDAVKNVLDEYLKNASDEFDNVVIDDATAWHRLAIFKSLEINQVNMPGASPKDKATNMNTVVPSVNEYRVSMEIMLQAIVACHDLCKNSGKNFILTAHERRIYVEKGRIGESLKLDKTMPWFQGVDKNPDGIAGLFDLVWHTEVSGKDASRAYQVRMESDDSKTIGSRFKGVFKNIKTGGNVDIVNNANLTDMFKQINDARKAGIETRYTPFTKV